MHTLELVKHLLCIFLKLLHLEITALKDLPPAPTKTYAVILKLGKSFSTVPKYLYFQLHNISM